MYQLDNETMLIRTVTADDWLSVAYLTQEESTLHRHLDWRSAQDWIGFVPFLILESKISDKKVSAEKPEPFLGERYLALLACPPDPPDVAWVRLFTYTAARIEAQRAWSMLWEKAAQQLKQQHEVQYAAAVAMQPWFAEVLDRSGFCFTHNVVSLIYHHGVASKGEPSEKNIRLMLAKDLPTIAQLDKDSFIPLWHYALPTLQLAFQHAAIATVWEEEKRILGYQICSVADEGGHLSRLAVHPEVQGKHIGTKLVQDLINRFVRRGVFTITVNTQQNNLASLAIYHRLGFEYMQENYPVYEYKL